jgi:YD repeat-containing protein
MGDIRLDYDLAHNLANQMYALRDKITSAANTGHDFTPSDIGPDPKAAQAITDFYGAWKKAFSRAGEAMTKLGNDFDAVGKAFFDADASTAVSANSELLQLNQSDWANQKAQYDQYQQEKGKYVAAPVTDQNGQTVYDKNGNPVTKQVPEWSGSAPSDPSNRPTDLTTHGAQGQEIHTHLIYQGDKLVGSESKVYAPKGTAGVTAPTDLQYTESTTYTANGGYTTDIHYADGSEQKIVVVAQPDGSATKSVYDGTGKLTSQFTGNVKSDQWQQN